MDAQRWGIAMALAMACCTGAVQAQQGVLERVKGGGKIVIAHRESSVPFSYVDPASGKPVGYALDLCLKLTEAVGKKVGVRNVPVEATEAITPLVIWRKELRQDSGGPGRYRGGLGQVMEVGSRENAPFGIFARFERVRHPARGRKGGGPGAPLDLARIGRGEVQLGRRVTHPNVVRVHDLGEHDNLLYMTMELVIGSTLRTVLRNEAPLPVHRAIEIARTMAVALGAAHSAGIIHRDLKPTNVLIESTGRVVLTDFGIARFLNEDLGLTQGIVGTMHYMAPEQVLSGHIDERSDLYALGVVLHEMLLGERPIGPTAQVSARLAQESARISPSLIRLLMSCLSVESTSRPNSAAAFVTAIDALQQHSIDMSADAEATKISAGKGAAPISSTRSPHSPVVPTPGSVPVVSVAPMTPAMPSNLVPAQKLAVLPFRYRGPSEHEYLADVLTDELVDAISRIRGLLVFGSGATQRFRTERDPAKVGQELGTPALIDGTVQAMGDRLRVSVRLVETATGLQRLTLQYDGRTSEIFDFQESVVRRVAEEMRVELVTMAHANAAPSEAVDLYLEARRELRNPDPVSSAHAVSLLDRAIELAPDFSPAIAAHAVACTRTWFLHMFSNRDTWADRTSASVLRASTYASHIAESHLAEGMFRANLGDYRAASAALQRALELAPACAPVHEYVGMLQCEAGHIKKGLQHLDLTTELDPTRPLVCG